LTAGPVANGLRLKISSALKTHLQLHARLSPATLPLNPIFSTIDARLETFGARGPYYRLTHPYPAESEFNESWNPVWSIPLDTWCTIR
jgi:hypothetical protein